jgi:hypothetical protein
MDSSDYSDEDYELRVEMAYYAEQGEGSLNCAICDRKVFEFDMIEDVDKSMICHDCHYKRIDEEEEEAIKNEEELQRLLSKEEEKEEED